MSPYKKEEPIHQGDIISFRTGETLVTHRILSVDQASGTAITKGDANQTADMNPVPYENVIGKVVHSVPAAGAMAEMFTSREGKMLAGAVIVGAILLQMLAFLAERREQMQ